MITITLNGQSMELPQELPLTDFLQHHAASNDDDDCFAVAINESFVPRSFYSNVTVKANDQIELLTPMQGG